MSVPTDNSENYPTGEAIKWIPLSLTLVEYPQGDALGKIFALISLLPFGIAAGFISLILFRRDLHTIFFFIGTVFSEMINWVLKHLIAQPRPVVRQVVYNEYGMPSSHSQFMWFFTTYTMLFVFIRLHHMNNNTIMENVTKAIITCTCVSSTFIICTARIYLQYHTFGQVFVGALVGILLASFWFCLTHFILTPLFSQVCSWRISELLLIRDTTLIPNVLWFEYANIRQEVRARSRKLVSMKSQ